MARNDHHAPPCCSNKPVAVAMPALSKTSAISASMADSGSWGSSADTPAACDRRALDCSSSRDSSGVMSTSVLLALIVTSVSCPMATLRTAGPRCLFARPVAAQGGGGGEPSMSRTSSSKSRESSAWATTGNPPIRRAACSARLRLRRIPTRLFCKRAASNVFCTSAPRETRSAAASVWPVMQAFMSAVAPSAHSALTGTPSSSNNCATATWPFAHADAKANGSAAALIQSCLLSNRAAIAA
mmetsp:Transcript_74517/g.147596  ORF Transcript_74517/g.147596 Transcript_74517/m.147596 type:complete len:242 (-) Transcript_74517:631-1356(-)